MGMYAFRKQKEAMSTCGRASGWWAVHSVSRNSSSKHALLSPWTQLRSIRVPHLKTFSSEYRL